MLSQRMLIGVVGNARYGNIGTTLSIPAIPFSAGIEADYGFDAALRLGYLVTPRTLGYVLAGYSYQHFDIDATGFGSIFDWDANGYVLGAGIETVLTRNLTLWGEYRYANYGTEDFGTGGILNLDSATHTFSVGLNYRFSGSNGSATSFETPAYNWTGLYIGGALGAGGLVHDLSILASAADFNGISGEGVFGEATIGYDHEFGSNWVAGVAANFRYSTIATKLAFTGFEASVDADYGFDVLARVGMKLDPATLAYVIGGYSWQHFEVGATGAGTIYDWGSSGFSIGAGLETALTDRITANVEYRYSQYQSEDFGSGGFISTTPSSHTVRAGVKFKLF